MSNFLSSLLPGHKETQKSGGSSYTHPLGKPASEHNPPHDDSHGHSHTEGESGLSSNTADNAAEQTGLATDNRSRDVGSTQRDSGNRDVDDGLAGTNQGVTGRTTAGRDAALAEEGAQGSASTGQDRQMGGAEDRQLGRGQGASGLETRDPYAAAAQAGALPNREDIQGLQDTTMTGRGTNETMNAGTVDSGAERSAPEHGLNAGANDPVALHGRAPVTEPIRPDSDMGPSSGMNSTAGMGTASGMSSDSAMGADAEHTHDTFDEQKLRGAKDGLVHGHHTTMTGENLDPHIDS